MYGIMVAFLEIISFMISTFILLILPGSLFLRFLKLNKISCCFKILLSCGASLSFLSLIGIVLNYTIGISSLSLRSIYSLLTIIWIFVNLHDYLKYQNKIKFKYALTSIKKLTYIQVVSLFLILGFALIYWSPYFNFHSADSGWHVFWAQYLINSYRLPNYDIVKPYNPPQVFVYGPHLLLASFSLIMGSSVYDIYWLPLVLFYCLTLFAILEFAKTSTNSYWAGFIASLFYITSNIPAGRIFLGNLPDLIGYFLLILLLLLIVEAYTFNKMYIAFGIIASSIISYYQYATLSITLTLVLAFILMLMFCKKEFFLILHMIRYRTTQMGILLFFMMTLIFSYHTTYINLESLNILSTTNWSPYVPNLSSYPIIISSILFFTGIIGLIVLMFIRKIVGIFMVSWFLALIFATNLPLLGVGIEPIRFLWHLVEPLSVSAGALIYLIIANLTNYQQKSFKFLQVRCVIKYKNNRTQAIVKSFMIIIVIVSFFSKAVTTQVNPPRRELYLTDDIEIGIWLATHATKMSVIAIDTDTDCTATWVQAYSQIPRFFYRADYAIGVASPPYKYLYKNASYLFTNPCSPDVMQIVRNYNLSYVIVHGAAVKAFLLSPFFEPVYITRSATVFKPRILEIYGVVKAARGYYVTMSSGKTAAVLASINITIQVNKPSNITLPIYGLVASPPLQATNFIVVYDKRTYAEFTVPKSNLTDACPDLAKLFKLQELGVNGRISVNIFLPPGLHTIDVVQKSDTGFAIYIEDLKRIGISINPSLLTYVTSNG
jgi:hypothetical protein